MVVAINKFQIPFGFLGSITKLGFLAGGYETLSTFSNKIDKFSFSSQTFSLMANNLSVNLINIGGITDISNVFLVGGGGTTLGSGSNVIFKIPISNLTISQLANTLTSKRSGTFTANYSQIGFVMGGSDLAASGTSLSSIDELNYSSNTVSLSSNSLPSTFSTGAGCNSVQTGSSSYAIAGYPTGNVSSACYKFNFSSRTFSTLATGASTSNMTSRGTCHSSNFGYKFRLSGYSIKVNFSNDTFSTPPTSPDDYEGKAFVFDSKFGYGCGGYSSSLLSSVYKLDMSTDTYSASSNMSRSTSNASQAQNIY